MNQESLMLIDPPQLSDEGAVEVVNFLHELTMAFENSYQHQLRRYHRTRQHQHDIFDDDMPEF